MSDDDILARGGTQEDVDSYAARNGAVDAVSMLEGLREDIDSAISGGLDFASRTEWNPQAVKDYDDMLDSVMQIVERRVTLARIDELYGLYVDPHDQQVWTTNSPAGVDLKIPARIAELRGDKE